MSEYSRIFDGWLTRYKLNRPLNKYELTSRLTVLDSINLPPIDRGLVKVNSSFMEYIDPYFAWRGWAAMWGVFLGGVLLYLTLLCGFEIYTPPGNQPTAPLKYVVVGWIATIFFGSLFVGVCLSAGTKDFFCYTHYPIRFSRKTRKIYVFQHDGLAGVRELDWEDAYWFVGKIRDDSRIYDLRCHILDDAGIIRHTFAVGYRSESRAEILQHWEMIRRYMEESPAALPFPPLHLFICTEPTLRNALINQLGAVNGLKALPLMVMGSIWAFFRWISQGTCRPPRWPAEVEAVCQIPEDDPYRQPEPWRMGELHGMTEEDELRDSEYTKLAKEAALAYEQANPVSPGR